MPITVIELRVSKATIIRGERIEKIMIRERINKIEELKREIKSHCMCFTFKETENHYLVIFPHGFSLDGVRAHKDLGKAESLSRILKKMEEIWNVF